MAKAKKTIARKKPAAKKPAANLSVAKVSTTLTLVAAKNKLISAKNDYGKLIAKSLATMQKSGTQATSKKRTAEAQKRKFKKLRITLIAKAKKSTSKTISEQLKKAKASYDTAAKEVTKIQAEAVAIKASVTQLKMLQKQHIAICKLVVKFEKDWAKKMAASKTKKPRKKKRKQAVKETA